jgi:hypothetical protein
MAVNVILMNNEVIRMYSDEEVKFLYLGIPFQDQVAEKAEEITFSDEEIKRFFLGLPLIKALVNLTLSVA